MVCLVCKSTILGNENAAESQHSLLKAFWRVFSCLEPKCPLSMSGCPHPVLHKRGRKLEHFPPFLSSFLQERGSLFLCQIKAYCSCEELEVGLYTLVQANKGCDNLICWYSNLWNHSSCCKEECKEFKVMWDQGYLFSSLKYISP